MSLGISDDDFDNIECIEFEVLIKGTPPNWADEYVVFVQVYDDKGNELAENNSNNSKANKFATDSWILKKITIDRSQLKSTKIYKIWVFEAGKDVEYWAGHFGTRFANEKIILTFSDSNKDKNSTNHIKQILGTRYLPNILPLSTNFNKSMGESIYYQGSKIKSNIKYNNLNNWDFNLSYNNYCVSLNFKEENKTNLASKMIDYDEELKGFLTCKVSAYATSDLAFNGTHCYEITGSLGSKECALVKVIFTNQSNLLTLKLM